MLFQKIAISFMVLFLTSSFFCNNIFSQSCEDCGKRIVGIYDASVSIPLPSNPTEEEKKNLMSLYKISGDISFALETMDTKRSCLVMFEMFLKASDSDTLNWKDSQSSAPSSVVLPPSGPINCLNYLIQPSIEGSEGNYKLNISLQAGYTREVVISGSAVFSNLQDLQGTVTQLISKSFIPLYDKIYDWEVNKRENDPEIAISPIEIEMYPSKEEVDINEEVNVDLRFLDCDKQPLKNKKIDLIGGEALDLIFKNSTGGKFLSDYVYTDNEGKAKAIFKVDDVPGKAVLRSYCIYKSPQGFSSFVEGGTYIRVKDLPSDVWKVNITLAHYYFSHRDTSWVDYVGNIPYSGFLSTTTNKSSYAEARGYIQNASNEEGVFYYSDDVSIIAPTAKGGFSENSISNNADYINGVVIEGDKRIDNYSGKAIPGSLNLQFYFNEKTNEKSIGAQVSFSGSGEYHGQNYDGGWKDYSGEDNNYGYLASSGWDGKESHGVIYKNANGGGFFGAYYHDTTYKKQTYTGTLTITEQNSISFTIHPHSPLTDVNEINKSVTDNFALYQNFPNPFNPGTNIRYSIGKRQYVKLRVFDIMGQEIVVLVNEEKDAGIHSINFYSENLSSGVYYYQLIAGTFIETKKFILLK